MSYLELDDGARLFYRFDGPEGAPVLLLSTSLGTALEMWEPQMAAFAARFRVLRYDSRGHGRSAVTPGPYSIEQLGRDALGLLDALGIETAQVCGLSKGGMVGQWLGIHAPERISRLVLANTSAHIGQPEVWNRRIETVRAEGMAAIRDGVIERWFTAPFRERAPEAVEHLAALLLATDPEGYAAACAAVRDMDQRSELPRIQAPTLVIAGRHDLATPPAQATLLTGAIPDARLVTLEAAHISNVEAAEAFTAAVLEHLR